MGLFRKTASKSTIQWRKLSEPSVLDDIVSESWNKPVIIFKHSTRCSISTMVKSRLESSWNYRDEEMPIYYLDLIQHRNISDKIAAKFKVKHASPQVLVIKDGVPVYHTSHNDIRPEIFESFL